MRLPGSTQVLPAEEGNLVLQRRHKKYRTPPQNPWLKEDYLAAAGTSAQQHAAHGSPAHPAERAGNSSPMLLAEQQPSSTMQGYSGHPNLAIWQSQHTDCQPLQPEQLSPSTSVDPVGEPFLAAHRLQEAAAHACSTEAGLVLDAGSPGLAVSSPKQQQQQPAPPHMPWQQQQQQFLVHQHQQQQQAKQLGQSGNRQHHHKLVSQPEQQQHQGLLRPGQLHPVQNQDSSPPKRPRSAHKIGRRF